MHAGIRLEVSIRRAGTRPGTGDFPRLGSDSAKIMPTPLPWPIRLSPPTVELHRGSGAPWIIDRAKTSADGWDFEITWVPDAQGVRVEWRLTARAGPPRFLESIRLRIPRWFDPQRTYIFCQGYQSWTPTRMRMATDRQRRLRPRSFALMTQRVDSPWFGRRDGFASHGVTLLREAVEAQEQGAAASPGAGESWLLGFLAAESALGEIFIGRQEVVASWDFGGMRMQPGRVVHGEPLWIVPGATLAQWAERVAEHAGVTVPARPSPLGWCSWYEYYTRVRAADVRANLDFVARHPELGVEVIQVDDGYQQEIGDWLRVNRKFPDGMQALAAEIETAGLRAGIWTAPFFVARRSELARRYPNYLLRTERGNKPVYCGYNPVWRRRLFGLDLSHPEVLHWLANTYATLCAQGYSYHKIDFLFAGLRRGRRYNPDLSPVAAYRQALRVIRDTLGGERFLLGCGAPLLPSVGLFDAMRISQDVKEAWEQPLLRRLVPDAGYPAVRGALRNVVARSFLHRRWWLNDPDCVLVRDQRTRLNLEEVRTLVTVMGMSGGMLFLADDLPRLAPERLEVARAILPPGPARGESLELPALAQSANPQTRLTDPQEVYEVKGEHYTLSAWIAWERPIERELPGGFDFWAGRMVGAGDSRPALTRIPAHGVRTRLRRRTAAGPAAATPVPHLAGTTLHLLALVDGRLRATYHPGEQPHLEIRGERMARRHGRIWLALPPGCAIRRLPSALRVVGTWQQGVLLDLQVAAWPWRGRVELGWK